MVAPDDLLRDCVGCRTQRGISDRLSILPVPGVMASLTSRSFHGDHAAAKVNTMADTSPKRPELSRDAFEP
jgi:hypothetical protein